MISHLNTQKKLICDLNQAYKCQVINLLWCFEIYPCIILLLLVYINPFHCLFNPCIHTSKGVNALARTKEGSIQLTSLQKEIVIAFQEKLF